MANKASFGHYLSARRHLLDLTQDELARRVGCSIVTIRKLEADERRPSKQIAERLADNLGIAVSERAAFLTFARIESSADVAEVPLPASTYTPDQRPSLPTSLTPLIGRDQDLAAVRNQLLRDETRLLTLVGTPGIGKTRLASAIAGDVQPAFDDGVVFVALAPISDPDLVVGTIAQTLGVKESGDQPLLATLQAQLADQTRLLILDNFEQVLAAAPATAELLAACPRLKVLATSRAALHVRGEQLYPVPPLLLPDLVQLPLVSALAEIPAVRLFVERAQAVQPAFQLTEANAATVAAICARLDGLPLAIELVAARVRLLSPAALLARLDDRLALLRDGPRDLPARQQTLRSAIAWSYDLLNADEQALFRRLGVFVGGCTLEAAEAVATLNVQRLERSNVLEGLSVLLDHSLLQQSPGPNGEPRFTMLETIREYALERLTADGERESLRRQHAEYFLHFVETAEPELIGPNEVEWLDRVEREHDNLRAVLQQALHPHATPDEKEHALRLAGAVRWLWRKRGYYVEGLRWYDMLLAATKNQPSIPGEVRSKALRGAGRMALDMSSGGSPTRGKELFEEARAISEQADDKAGLAEALNNLGWVPVMAGDPGSGIPLFEQSLVLYRELGDTRGAAAALYTLAFANRDLGNDDRAVALLIESQPLFRATDDTGGLAWSYWLLGQILNDKSEHAQAAALFEDAERLFRRLGEKWGLTVTLERLGTTALAQGDYARAETFASEAVEIDREMGDPYTLANALHILAAALLLQGKFEQSGAHLNESLTISRELEDNPTIGWGLLDLAKLAREQGDGTRAITLFEESLSVFRTRGDRWGIPWNLVQLGLMAQQQGDDARAARLLDEALSLFQNSGLTSGYSLCFAGLAGVAASRQNVAGAQRAARLLASASALLQSSGAVPEPFERAYLDRITASARAQLGEAAFAAASEEGRAMRLEQTIAYALDGSV
jgi:predicted ATPase/DNA-binding XRE family transcriptional regulator